MRTPVGHHCVAGFLQRSLRRARNTDNRMERCADWHLIHRDEEWIFRLKCVDAIRNKVFPKPTGCRGLFNDGGSDSRNEAPGYVNERCTNSSDKIDSERGAPMGRG